MNRKTLFILVAVVVIASLFAMPAVAQSDNPVQQAAEEYFAGGTKNIKAKDLFANLNDGDASNDPFMVDIRAPEDYANGHIKGAVNIPGKVLFNADGLAKLPKDKPIVLNCYSGQTASQIDRRAPDDGLRCLELALRRPVLGHEREGHLPVHGRAERQLQVSTEAATLGEAGDDARAAGRHPEAAAMAYFPDGFKAVKAADLFANLNDGDDQQRPGHPGHPQRPKITRSVTSPARST